MAHRSIPQPPPAEASGADDEAEPRPLSMLRSRPPGLFAGLGAGRLAARLETTGAATVVGSAMVLACVLAGGWWLLRPAAAPVEASVPTAASVASEASTAAPADGVATTTATSAAGSSAAGTAAPLVVQAAGAVSKPGVYRLDAGARVDDLIRQAGGLTTDADRDRINLAAPLADGERIWVPARGQVEIPDVVAGGTSGGGSAGPGAPGGAGGGPATGPSPTSPVDLNAATADELDALPGVGPATAAAILAYRDQVGRFASVDELLEVRGIGDAKLEQLRPLVRV